MPTTAPIDLSPDESPVADQAPPLPLTTSAPRAAALYREAIERVHGAEAGAEALLDQALACDPSFALAHVARAMLAQAEGDADTATRAREAAASCLDPVTLWERGHVASMTGLLQRRPDAWDRAREHLALHPGDLLVASQLIGDLFFHGREGKRQAVVDVLREIEPCQRHDWAFQVRLGFHVAELGDPGAALPLLEAALRARPQAPFVAHAMAHALLESGQRAASYRFLRDWVDAHDPAGPIGGHIHWHLALGELESARPAVAVERYRRFSAPGVSHCALGLMLADAGGLFGRMLLDGAPLDGLPRGPIEALLASLGGALRIPFVAVHAAALAVVLDDGALLERCAAAMEQRARERGTDAEQRVVHAFMHYHAGDMRACVEALERDLGSAFEAIGGSNEERALIEQLHARATARAAEFNVRSNGDSHEGRPA